MDNGRSVAQRAWMLSFANAVVARNFQTKATEVLIFDIQAKWLGRQRATFDQWNDDGDKLRSVESLFQLFVTGVAKVAEMYLSSNADTYQNPKCAIRVYLETVLCDPSCERSAQDSDYDAQETAWTMKKLEEIYDGRVTEAQLRASNSTLDTSGSGAPDRIEFMNGYANRRVASYRIWVMINEASVKLSDAILAVFQTCCDRESDRQNYNQLAADARNGGGGKKRTAPGAGGAEQRSAVGPEPVSDLILPQERQWLINSPAYLVFATSMYLGVRNLVRNKDDVGYAARNPIKNGQNEAHPSKTFGAMRYFADCARNRLDIDPLQRTLDRYYDPVTRMWSFERARSNCVLVVGAEHWRNRNLLTMYTPDYQRRNIEPRLVWMQRSRRTQLDPVEPVAAQAQPPPPPPAAGGGSNADDDEDSELLSAVNFSSVGAFQPVGGAAPAAGGLNQAAAAGEDEESSSSSEGESDSSADLRARIDAEYQAALRAPAERQAAHAAQMAAIEPPRPLTEEEREKMEREQEEDYMRTLQMGFQDIQARKRAEEMASAGSLGGASATVCHELRSRYFMNESAQIEAIKDETVRLRERLRMSLRAIEEYTAKATSPHSNVSPPHQAMNSWATEQRRLDRLRFLRDTRFLDPRLSYFAQSVIRVYSDAERLCSMHTSHDVLFLLYVCSRSALLYDRDKLRNNVLLFGEHATSKSFALTELCKKMLIPGTFISVTTQSRQAANTDTHTNDLVMVHEELEQKLISKNTKESEMQDAFKDSLTRGMTTRLLCFIADNGKRQQIVASSEKNMCLIGACNSRREDIADPIADRMILSQQVPRNRLGVSIGQTMSGAHGRSHERHVAVAEMQHDYALRQYIHNEVEKLIMIGAISEPHLACFNPIYNFYETVLKSEFSINVKRRQMDQLRMLLRSLVIMAAIEWLYNSPAGFCHGKRYSPAHLLLLEPMLHDNEEIVYMALDMCRHMLVDPNQEALIEFFRSYYIPAAIGQEVPSLREAFDSRDLGSTGQSATINDVDELATQLGRLSTAAADPEFESLKKFFQETKAKTKQTKTSAAEQQRQALQQAQRQQPQGEQEQRALEEEACAVVDQMAQKPTGNSKAPAAVAAAEPPGERNYNYFVFQKKMRALCEDIATHMTNMQFRRAMSSATISDVLMAMTRQAIPTKIYRRAPTGRWPPVCVEPDSERRRVTSMQVRVGADGQVMLHSMLAFFERGSPHEHAINRCMNRYTPAGFFIAGRPVSDQIPHLVHVRRALQTPRIPTYIDGANMHKPLHMSYNQYSTKERLEWLGIPLNDVTMSWFDPICSDSIARAEPGAIVENPVVYPDDTIKTDMLAARQNMDIQQLCAAGITTDAYGNRLTGLTLTLQPVKRALSADAQKAKAHLQAEAYSSLRVFTDADYHNNTTETTNSLYDREKISTINLATYDDPCIQRAAEQAAAVAAVDITDAPAPKWPTYDATDDDVDGAGPRGQPYSKLIDQTAREQSWHARGHRQQLISEATSTNLTFTSVDEDLDEECSSEPRITHYQLPWLRNESQKRI